MNKSHSFNLSLALFVTFVLCLTTTLIYAANASAGEALAQHVVVVGCDGMSPDGVRKADTPAMDRLMKEGAFTLHARAVMPTSSSSNWASMIMGAGPEQHGVTSNDWQPGKYEIEPTVKGPGGIFPTIFSVIRQQRPGAFTAAIYDWDDFGRLFERDMVDVKIDGDGPADTTNKAVEIIKTKKPLLTFIHLDHVDHAGHEFGHGTPEYYQAVEEADRYIADVVKAIQDAGIADSTFLLVTADHGGVGKGHGGATMPEIEIPWIAAGSGVKHKEIAVPVDTFDTASTIAYVLGLKQPDCWIARPVMAAFE